MKLVLFPRSNWILIKQAVKYYNIILISINLQVNFNSHKILLGYQRLYYQQNKNKQPWLNYLQKLKI